MARKEAEASNNVRKELVREQLIDKAAELFSTRGYSQTTIEDIARALDLGRSSLYHYFRNKEEILQALIEEQTVGASHNMEELIADRSISHTERVRRAVSASVLRKLAESARFRVLDKVETEMSAEMVASHNRIKRHVLDLWSKVIADGIADGEFHAVDARIAAFALLGMSNWTAWWYSPKGRKSPQEIADAIAGIGVRSLVRHDRDRSATTLKEAISTLQEDLQVLERFAR